MLAALLLATARLGADESPGKFAFHIFPPAASQQLGFASRPVSDGRGGFWFLNLDSVWRFDASGYRALGPKDGLPDAPVDEALPEPSTGLWFRCQAHWYLLGHDGLRPMPEIPGPRADVAHDDLVLRNEGFASIQDGRMSIYGPTGTRIAELPSPGPGNWVKGWRNLASEERLVVGDQGLARWDGHSWRIQSLTGLLDGRPWDVLRVRSGALWVRSDRDLARIEPRLEFTRNSYVSIEEDSFGRVWTNGPEGLACVDGDHVWQIGEREGLFGDHAYWPIAFDRQSSLWTISAMGFQRLKGAFLWSVQERPQGLPRAMVFDIERLRDGRLCVGTHDGLYWRDGRTWRLVPGTRPWGIFTIAERGGGEIWCGGNPPSKNNTLLRIRPGGAVDMPVVPGLPSGVWVLSLCWGGPGCLWCGTLNEGLFRIEDLGRGWRAVREPLPGSDPHEGITWIGRAPDRSLWLVDPKGAYQWQGGAWKHFGKAEGLAADEVTGAFAGPRGEFWLLHGDSKAATRLQLTPGKGWTVAGILREPLMANGGTGGWTDPEGHVWIMTANELIRWDGQHAEHHSKAFGLPIDTLYDGAIHGESDGHLYVGTTSGLICFEPRFYQPIPDPPALEAGEALDGAGRPFLSGARLPFRKSGVSFGIMLPLVDGVEDIRCETRLVGLDEEWRPLEGHLIRFPGLSPGRYILEARAARRDGLYGPTLTFPFTILWPWYLRSWAWLLWVSAAGVLFSLFLRWRTWAMRGEQARLEGIVAQRTSDLVLANDALVQALTEVKTLKGLVPICCYCKKIRDDEGFWNQIERYVQDHSEAKFSHGICPDCEGQLRSEMATYHGVVSHGGAPANDEETRP
jgi:hypothetical protein